MTWTTRFTKSISCLLEKAGIIVPWLWELNEMKCVKQLVLTNDQLVVLLSLAQPFSDSGEWMFVLWSSTSECQHPAKIPSLALPSPLAHLAYLQDQGALFLPNLPLHDGLSIVHHPKYQYVAIVLSRKKPWPEVQRFKFKSQLCVSGPVWLWTSHFPSLSLGASSVKYLEKPST